MPPPCAFGDRRGEKYLEACPGEYYGSDVAPRHDQAYVTCHSALLGDHLVTHLRNLGNYGNAALNLGIADEVGQILAINQHGEARAISRSEAEIG